MRALVSGATGFIGGALAASLVEEGWDVTVLVRSGSLNRLANPDRYCVNLYDLGDGQSPPSSWFEGVDVVFHAAAIRDRWGASREAYRQVNVEGTRRLLDAAQGRAGRFVYISSVGVFGRPGVLGVDEAFRVSPGQGKVGYHTSKAAAEQLVLERAGQMEVAVVRPTITYGPGDSDGMLTRLAAMIAAGRFVRVGNGRNHLHLTYIDDLLAGLRLVGRHEAAPGQVFVLAGPSTITSGEMIGTIATSLGKRRPAFYLPEGLARPAAWLVEMIYLAGARVGLSFFRSAPLITRDKVDTLCLHRGFSSAKAQQSLGYLSKIGFDEGLERTLEWMSSVNLMVRPGGNDTSPPAHAKAKT